MRIDISIHIIKLRTVLLSAIMGFSAFAVSCSGNADFYNGWKDVSGQPFSGQTSGYGNIGDRTASEETRRVMILYSAGFNSLSHYLKDDIEDLKSGYLPSDKRSDNVLLVFSKQPVRNGEYGTKTSPVLFRLYKDIEGRAVSDTLLRLPEETIAASSATFGTVLKYVKDNFHAVGYGVIVSSHATGWLPNGYYNNPSKYDSSWEDGTTVWGRPIKPSSSVFTGGEKPFPYVELPEDPNFPAVKSITQENAVEDGIKMSYEAELEAFAKAIPMHLDYLLFDACLMGGIEVAYAFKDYCSYIGFSQTEVLAEGYDYRTIAQHLIGSSKPDPASACSDYFEYYNGKSGSERSATVSFVDCSRLGGLAAVCKELFSKYRSGIATINPIAVQHYFRFNRHWFYDLKDIISKAGATDADLERLQQAIDASILYKGATPSFLSIEIKTFSGFSMYLPSAGSPFLDNYYKTLSWNTATSLVQ